MLRAHSYLLFIALLGLIVACEKRTASLSYRGKQLPCATIGELQGTPIKYTYNEGFQLLFDTAAQAANPYLLVDESQGYADETDSSEIEDLKSKTWDAMLFRLPQAQLPQLVKDIGCAECTRMENGERIVYFSGLNQTRLLAECYSDGNCKAVVYCR